MAQVALMGLDAEAGPVSAPHAVTFNRSMSMCKTSGILVKIEGSSNPQINSKRGTLCQFIPKIQRWEVDMEGVTGVLKVSVRTRNMVSEEMEEKEFQAMLDREEARVTEEYETCQRVKREEQAKKKQQLDTRNAARDLLNNSLTKLISGSKSDDRQNIKVTCIGDKCSSKRALLNVMGDVAKSGSDKFRRSSCDALEQSFSLELKNKVTESTLCYDLWDTTGQEQYDRLMRLSYPGSEMILLVYSTSVRESLYNIQHCWLPQQEQFAPDAWLMLIGVSRDDDDNIEVLTDEGQSMAVQIGASTFNEVNIADKEGIAALLTSLMALSELMYSPEYQRKKPQYSEFVKV